MKSEKDEKRAPNNALMQLSLNHSITEIVPTGNSNNFP